MAKLSNEQKIQWMEDYCERNGLELSLDGTCGFGRACVGVLKNGLYPDYMWHSEGFKRIDQNGRIWTPKNAYGKHTCVAVLIKDDNLEEAASQLYAWLKWFEKNNFVVKVERLLQSNALYEILGLDNVSIRMVKVKSASM